MKQTSKKPKKLFVRRHKPPLGETMQIPLVVDQRDYRWQLLKKILKVFDLRKVRKIMARYTLKAIPILKIVTASMFFSTRISHVTNELRNKEELRKFLKINKEEIPKVTFTLS